MHALGLGQDDVVEIDIDVDVATVALIGVGEQ
jgi:hypothetical protein